MSSRHGGGEIDALADDYDDPRMRLLETEADLERTATRRDEAVREIEDAGENRKNAEAVVQRRRERITNIMSTASSGAFISEELTIQAVLLKDDEKNVVQYRRLEADAKARKTMLETRHRALVRRLPYLNDVRELRNLETTPLQQEIDASGVVEENMPVPRRREPLFLPECSPSPLPHGYGGRPGTSSPETTPETSDNCTLAPTCDASATSLLAEHTPTSMSSGPALFPRNARVPHHSVEQPEHSGEMAANMLQLDLSSVDNLLAPIDDPMDIDDDEYYQDESTPMQHPIQPPKPFAKTQPQVQALSPPPTPFWRSAAPSPSSGAPGTPPSTELVFPSADMEDGPKLGKKKRAPHRSPRTSDDNTVEETTRAIHAARRKLRLDWPASAAPNDVLNSLARRPISGIEAIALAASFKPPPFCIERCRRVTDVELLEPITQVMNITLALHIIPASPPEESNSAALTIHAALNEYIHDLPQSFWHTFSNLTFALVSAYAGVGMLSHVPLDIKNALPAPVLKAIEDPKYKEYLEGKAGCVMWPVPIPCTRCDFMQYFRGAKPTGLPGNYELRACFAYPRRHHVADKCFACVKQHKSVECFMGAPNVPAAAVALHSVAPTSTSALPCTRPNTPSTSRPFKRPRLNLPLIDHEDEQPLGRACRPGGCSPGDSSDMDISDDDA